MKSILHTLFLVFSLALFAQQTYMPDDNFEQALIDLGYDDILDDFVLTSNINTVTDLPINNRGIYNLTGIEYFFLLKYLNCSENQIEEIDLSHNANLKTLGCYDNNLLNINLVDLINLEVLSCSLNP